MTQKPQTPIYDQALKYLDSRMHSVGDLKVKLKRKGYGEDEIEEVIAKLQESDFLNDELYAKTYLSNLIEYKTYGYYGIYKKLIHKRLDRDLVEGLLKDALDKQTEKQIALKYLEGRRRANKKAALSALSRRGFRSEVIFEILEDFNDS